MYCREETETVETVGVQSDKLESTPRTTMREKLIEAVTAVGKTVPDVSPQSPGYECAFCQYPYDEQRTHCLACGGPVREGV